MAENKDPKMERRLFRPEDYSADSLWKICLRFCAKYPLTFCMKEVTVEPVQEGVESSEAKNEEENFVYILRSSLFLPSQISDALMAELLRQNGVLTDPLLHIFTDVDKCQLRNLNLKGSKVTDKFLGKLMKHRPVHVNLSECSRLTSQSLLTLTDHGKNLVTLNVGPQWGLFSDLDFAHEGERNSEMLQSLVQNGPNFPQLRALTMKGLAQHPSWHTSDVLQWFLKPSPPLTYIDISGCDIKLGQVDGLSHLATLNKLVVHNTRCREETFVQIAKCKSLQALDISQTRAEYISVENPGCTMINLLKNLPKLRWLDISGTALCCEMPLEEPKDSEESGKETVFTKGLEGRQLDFLGLMMCPKNPSLWPDIPAAKITGDYQPEHLLLALEMYLQRPVFLRGALVKLLNLLRSVQVNLERALLGILEVMRHQKKESSLQQCALGCLVYTITSTVEGDTGTTIFVEVIPNKLKQELVLLTLDAMELHESVPLTTRGCFIFRYLTLPQDLIFVHERAVRLLCRILSSTFHLENESLIQLVLYIMKPLSSQVDISLKERAGEIGAIEVMLDLVRLCISSLNENEDILRAIWSILWSLTDMAKGNSIRFIDFGGMMLFSECYERYDDPSLRRKIIGMMVNIAEVETCRPHLMDDSIVRVFLAELLEESCISTSACGVLAHILADGAEAWKIEEPSREEVRKHVRKTVMSWDLDVSRKVRYRSFAPLHRLFTCWDTPEAQYWAIWDVRSMVMKDPTRYIPMLQNEGAIDLLTNVRKDERIEPQIESLIEDILRVSEGRPPRECEDDSDSLSNLNKPV